MQLRVASLCESDPATFRFSSSAASVPNTGLEQAQHDGIARKLAHGIAEGWYC